MPSIERGGSPESEHPLYQRVARFPGERAAGRVYERLQEIVYTAPACDLSVFRLQLNRIYHVAVLGVPPPEALERRISRLLANGVPATLPSEALAELLRRRAEAITQAPWIERHYRPGEQV